MWDVGEDGGIRGGSSAKEVLRSSAAGRKKKESVYCVFQYTWYYLLIYVFFVYLLFMYLYYAVHM